MNGGSWSFVCLQATEVKVNEVEFNPEFVVKMIPKLEWSALVQAAEEVELSNDAVMWLPGTVQVFNYLDHYTFYPV